MSAVPEEQGSFEQLSLSLLFIRALDRRWTGTLTIEPPSGGVGCSIELQRGLACRALVGDGYARLGEVLHDAGVLTRAEVDQALARPGLIGQTLRAQNIIDDKTLQRALVLQLLQRMMRVFGYPPSTTWLFTPDLAPFVRLPEGVRIDTLRVLWAGLTAHGEMGNWLPLTLKRIGEQSFQVRPDVNLRRYGFTGDARRVVRTLRDERVGMRDLMARAMAPEDVVKQIVYLLAITRYLDFAPVGADSTPPTDTVSSSGTEDAGMMDEPSISDETTSDETASDEVAVSDPLTSSDEEPTPRRPRRVARIKLRRVALRPAAPDPPGSGEPRPVASRSSSEGQTDPPSSDRGVDRRDERRPASSERVSAHQDTLPDANAREHVRAEIKSRLGRLGRETPFTLLNVVPAQLYGKSEAEITDILWSAYERCSRRWHPDNCPQDLSELREGMARIYDAMTEAFMSLTESDDRHDLIQRFAATAAINSELPPTMRSEMDEQIPELPAPREPPPSGERRIDQSTNASDLHAKALVALSEQRLDEALALCRDACAADPENPDYLASSVWIRASMDASDTKLLVLDLDSLLRDHPDHIQARFYRGILRRRLGSDNAATRDFQRVLELQPSHSGAKVQLAAMGRASSV